MTQISPILFSGSSHVQLAEEVASLLHISLGQANIHRFPDKEISLEILDEVENQSVFVLQSLAFNPNEYLMELFIILDALKRASSKDITVVLPYYSYARQDRLHKSKVPITAKLVANLLTAAGASAVITVDLHSEQIEGFFDIPVEHLLTRSLLIPYCRQLNLHDLVVVASDNGAIKIASDYAKQLSVPMALIDKERIDSFHVAMNLFVGEVKGHTVLLPDDMCSTATTIVHAAEVCADLGAKRIIAMIGHGLFVEDALEKIEKSPIELIVTTNSVSISKEIASHQKIKIVSIAPLLVQAIQSRTKIETKMRCRDLLRN